MSTVSDIRDRDVRAYGNQAQIWTPGTTALPDNVKAVVFSGTGSIKFKNSTGGSEIVGYPVIHGAPLPFVPAVITEMTGPTICFIII